MKKLVGYIISAVGLVLLAVSSIPAVSQKYLAFLPAFVQIKYVMIAALILVIFGAVISFDKFFHHNKQASPEVPIYEGNKVVGYRRH